MGIPRHLHSLGRKADPDFKPKEWLYRRFRYDGADLTATIKFGRMSVNRGGYSDGPDDVLWNDETGARHENCGVVEFYVEALSGRWEHPTREIDYQLEPIHSPNRCNYPHSEVVVYERDRQNDECKLVGKIKPASVKLKIRQHLESWVRIAIPKKQAKETLPIEKREQ